MKSHLSLFLSAAICMAYSSCSKEEIVPVDGDDNSPIDTDGSLVRIVPLSSLAENSDRYTFPGREVCLAAVAPEYEAIAFSWAINGKAVESDGRLLKFTPDQPGTYHIRVEAAVKGAKHIGECDVFAVDATEERRRRVSTASSSETAIRVFEYLPAPGQFVGDVRNAGTPAEAAEWAQERMQNGKMISLGAFGGYITVGFDHSVVSSDDGYDFVIRGNAFVTEYGSSNEPAIVWVMQDANGNGLPDDEWYELRGSEYDSATTLRNTYVTYHRPSVPGLDVEWTDAEGASGVVTYLSSLKKTGRDYYPSWINADSYTLYGSRIAPRNALSPAGKWENMPYPWGYADNIGSDNLEEPALGPGSHCGFCISNAVNADGSPVRLGYIDFVKVQCATQAESGPLGEVSTEIFTIKDLNIRK